MSEPVIPERWSEDYRESLGVIQDYPFSKAVEELGAAEAAIGQLQAALRRAMEALCWAHGRNPDPDYPSVLEQGKAALASTDREPK